MVWLRLDDTFADDPVLDSAGPLASWLHVAALCYSNRNLTDGFIPHDRLRRLTAIDDPDEHAAQLVNLGVWQVTAGGYRIVHHLDLQPTAEDVRRKRKLATERQARWRRSSRTGRYVDASTDALRDALVDAAPTRPVKAGRSRARARATGDPKRRPNLSGSTTTHSADEHSAKPRTSSARPPIGRRSTARLAASSMRTANSCLTSARHRTGSRHERRRAGDLHRRCRRRARGAGRTRMRGRLAR